MFNYYCYAQKNNSTLTNYLNIYRPIFSSVFISSGLNNTSDLMGAEVAIDFYNRIRLGLQYGLGMEGSSYGGYTDLLLFHHFSSDILNRSSYFFRIGIFRSQYNFFNKFEKELHPNFLRNRKYILAIGIDRIYKSQLQGYFLIGVTYFQNDDSNIWNKRLLSKNTLPMIAVGIGIANQKITLPNILKTD